MKQEEKHINYLEEIPKEQPFSVPEGYFLDFEARLDARIHQEHQEPRKVFRLIQYLKPALGLAASFLLVFMLVYYPLNRYLPEFLSGNNQTSEQENPISLASLDDDGFYDILSEDLHSEEIKTEEILDFLTVELSDYEIISEMYN